MTSREQSCPDSNDPTAPSAKLRGEFKQIKTKSNQESDAKKSKISDSKDKAQLSTTGSLSLSLIVVLKKLVDDAINGVTDPMLFISLLLVSLAIIFQVIITFVSIRVYSLKSESMSDDQFALAAIPTKRSTQYSERIFRSSSDTDLNRRSKKDKDELHREQSITSQIFQLFRDLDSSDSKHPWYAFLSPCFRKSEYYIEERYNLNETAKRLHDILNLEKFKATMEYAEAEVNASKFGDLKVTIPTSGYSAMPTVDDTQAVLESKWRRLNTLTTQHKLLELKMQVQSRRRHFGKLFKLQQQLTYLAYVVLIMNSFVAGFGFV